MKIKNNRSGFFIWILVNWEVKKQILNLSTYNYSKPIRLNFINFSFQRTSFPANRLKNYSVVQNIKAKTKNDFFSNCSHFWTSGKLRVKPVNNKFNWIYITFMPIAAIDSEILAVSLQASAAWSSPSIHLVKPVGSISSLFELY